MRISTRWGKEHKQKQSAGLQAKHSWFEKLSVTKQDLFCVIFMYVVILILFHAIVFDNMIFSDSGDTASAQSWAKALTYIEHKDHVYLLWMPYIFCCYDLSALRLPARLMMLKPSSDMSGGCSF